MEIFLLAVIVFFLSILFSMIGIGGASIYVPLFYSLGFELNQAIALGLFLNISTTFFSSINFYRKKIMINEKKVLLTFLITIITGSLLSSIFFKFIDQIFVKIFLIIFLILGSINIATENPHTTKTKIKNRFFDIIFGLIVGIGTGIAGIGGGILLIPYLIKRGLDTKNAIAISHFCVFFASLITLLIHLNNGLELEIINYIPIVLIAIIGSEIGSWIILTNRIDNRSFRKIFVLIASFFIIKLILELV
jgi:uncharacterized membrane protein YfcA